MDELVGEVLADEEAWFVGGAVRDELLGRPVVDVDVVCADPQAAARRYARHSGGAPFPLSAKHASWRVVRPDDRLHAGARHDRVGSRSARLHDQRNRGSRRRRRGGRPQRRPRGPSAAARARGLGVGLRGRPATARARGATRGRARLQARAADRGARPLGGRPHHGGRRRAGARRARADDRRRIPPPRRARASGGARRSGRRAAPPRRLAALPARRGLRREPAATPGLERGEALRARTAPCREARERLRARAAPLPPRDRALGSRRARVRGCCRAGGGGPGGTRRGARRAAGPRRRARASAGARDRPAPPAHRGGTSGRHDLDARRGAGAGAPRGQLVSNVDDVRARFGATAGRVAEHAEAQVEPVREQLRTFVAPAGDERALDVGTGPGTLALALAPLVREAVGVDVVPELHHVARPELVVEELARVTRPGGAVFVDDQIAPVDPLAALELDRFERARDPSHTRTLPDVDLRGLFDANDLVLRRTRFQQHRRELDYYLDLAGCEGEPRERARALSPGGPDAYVAESGWYLLQKR